VRPFFKPADGPPWLGGLLKSIRGAMSDEWHTPLRLKTFTVAGVPAASEWAGGMIYVADESGGAVPAYSDGTDWRRVTDGVVIS
jgi:hypothetical protein